MNAPLSLENSNFHHACNACGKCCNSAPRATLAELFENAKSFIGCLSVEFVFEEKTDHPLTFRLPSASRTLVRLGAKAFSYSSLARCPSLLPDGKCALHGTTKPKICHIVPFDADFSEGEQLVVLRNRKREAHALGIECLSDDPQSELPLVVERGQLTVPSLNEDFAAYRRDLEKERRLWGEEVFSSLAPELRGETFAKLWRGKSLTFSLVPLLVITARDGGRASVIEYLRSQLELLDETIRLALARRSRDDRAETELLRSFRGASERLLTHLAR